MIVGSSANRYPTPIRNAGSTIDANMARSWAHPYNRDISDDRPRGNAIVERVYDERCPRGRDEDTVAKRTRQD